MTQVDSDIFLELFSKVQISESDEITYQSFLDQCSKAETFLLLADNCGEIVLERQVFQFDQNTPLLSNRNTAVGISSAVTQSRASFTVKRTGR